jgi:hypothetical protein
MRARCRERWFGYTVGKAGIPVLFSPKAIRPSLRVQTDWHLDVAGALAQQPQDILGPGSGGDALGGRSPGQAGEYAATERPALSGYPGTAKLAVRA